MGCNCKKNRQSNPTAKVMVNSTYLSDSDYDTIESVLRLYTSDLSEIQISNVTEYLMSQKQLRESSGSGGFRVGKSASDTVYTGPTVTASNIWKALSRRGIYTRLSNITKTF